MPGQSRFEKDLRDLIAAMEIVRAVGMVVASAEYGRRNEEKRS